MAGANSSSKGNGASKRMMNVKLKEKRARSWKRGEAKKLANKKLNEQQHSENKHELSVAGVRAQTVTRIKADGKSHTYVESPSKALRRHRRLVTGITK